MQKFFVTSDTAQIVSFGAKIVVGLTIPQIASLISFVSTPKALIFFFFGDFGNLFALANDIRWYPSVRRQRKRKNSIHSVSIIMVVLAIMCCSAVLVTDLLLFQLPTRKNDYQLKQTKTNFSFSDSEYQLGESNYLYPEVMKSNKTAQNVFGNMEYASTDGGIYKNYKTVQSYHFTIDGPQGDINAPGNYTGNPRCTVAHNIAEDFAKLGASPVQIHCYLDNVREDAPNIVETNVNTLGFNGKKVVSYYQTEEGANYLFVELVQRDYDRLETNDESSGVNFLEAKIQGFEKGGYTLENAFINFISINMTQNTLSLRELLEYSGRDASKKNETQATGSFLFSKTEFTLKYGRIPMYTKKFILWGTYLNPLFFAGQGGGDLYAYTYDTRQYLVINRYLRRSLYGLTSVDFDYDPVSVQVSTDLSDDKIVLATLQNPNYPLKVIETEMVNILPGVIVIGFCGLFILISMTVNQVGRYKSNTHLPFDINLEIFHKALENLNNGNAWYLPAKLEGSKNIAMAKGVTLISNKYAVGLVSTGGVSGNSSGIELHSVNEEHNRHFIFHDV